MDTGEEPAHAEGDSDAGRKRKRVPSGGGGGSSASGNESIPDDVYQDVSEDEDDANSQDGGFIDDSEQETPHRPVFEHSASSSPRPSRAGSDGESATPPASVGPDEDQEEAPAGGAGAVEDDGANPLHSNSNNNLSRSLRMIDIYDFNELNETDGMPLYWLSESVGPSIPPMAMQQILCLQHLLNFPLNSEHILSNGVFEVVWTAGRSRGKKGRIMSKLLHHIKVDDEMKSHRIQNRQRFERATIDEYPHDFYCNFSVDPGADRVTRVVPFAEIILSPCVASYRSLSTGARLRKVFWLVILKTKVVYNVCRHLCDFLRQKDLAGVDTVTQKRMEDVYLLWQEVILHQHSMSPSIMSMYKREKVMSSDPLSRLDQEGDPDSLMACCNVFEVYRAMRHRCREQGVRAITTRGCLGPFCASVRHPCSTPPPSGRAARRPPLPS